MAELYETKLHAILDRLLVLRTSTRRRRPSDLWFDDDCRSAKRLCRTSTSIDALCVRRQCAEAAAASLLQTGHSEAWSVLAASHHTAKPDAKTNVAVDWQRTSWIEVSCPPTLLSAPPTSIVFWIKKSKTFARLRLALLTRSTVYSHTGYFQVSGIFRFLCSLCGWNRIRNIEAAKQATPVRPILPTQLLN